MQIFWPIGPKQEKRRSIETEETKFDVHDLDDLTVKNSLYSMPSMVWHLSPLAHELIWFGGHFFAGSGRLDSLELKKKK